MHIHCPDSTIVNGRKFQEKRIGTQPTLSFVTNLELLYTHLE